MPGGRPAKPISVKKSQGTLRKSRLVKDAPTLKPGRPAVPASIADNAVAFAEWDRLCSDLLMTRVLSAQDRGIVEIASLAYAEYMEAIDALAGGGIVYETTNTSGARIIKAHPAVAIRSDAWRRYKAALGEVGLSPSARQKVAGLGSGEEDDPGEAFFN